MNKERVIKMVGITAIMLGFLLMLIYTLSTEVVVGPDYQSKYYSTWVALVPPAAAILLALVTKEVISSLFLGIVTGALLYSGFDLELAFRTMLFGVSSEGKAGGVIPQITDSGHAGILVFIVVLGILVALMNKAGGSAAFGRWASKRIKTRVGAQMATIVLGMLIFVDDYFNCLTVGSVMRPVTDGHKVSRAKLAYLIDATSAPICIIAPISSWAAAVTSSVPKDLNVNGFSTFIQTIPYNFYAILTIVMMIYTTVRRVDYGPMKLHELNAIKGDLFTTGPETGEEETGVINPKAKVLDLVLPVIVLIIACVIGMIYSGGFFNGAGLVDAFANADASVGLVYGAFIALIFTFFYYMYRDIMSFKEFMECIPRGFIAMVVPFLILTLAWTLSGMTGLLGANVFVAETIGGSAASLHALLPAVIFLVALALAFATGTSWGSFGILLPIVLGVFRSGEMMVMSIAACLAGAVCGDHCSPISDTTIMASAGAQSNHLNHVSTQLPYALTVAAVSTVTYVVAGYTESAWIALPTGIVLMIGTLIVIEKIVGREREDTDVGETADVRKEGSDG